MSEINRLLRKIPKVDEFLADSEILSYYGKISRERILRIVRGQLHEARVGIAALSELDKEELFENVKKAVLAELDDIERESLRRVINATGIIIHTNFGRAPLSKKAAAKLSEIAGGYSNLEYSVVNGVRRSRLEAVERMLCDLSGAEAAHVVNNNAAAILLALNTLASGREVVLSRSEIVEIGDSFRINEIIETSGCKICEAGASNVTRLRDYERAVNENTSALLKVHRSNFRISGYTEETNAAELVALAKEKNLLVMEDMGSGVLFDTSEIGLRYERQVADALRDGIDIITISGDKLLGGPQAGIIFGKKTYIERMKRNQLTRCLRADKLCLAALEAVLGEYSDAGNRTGIPALRYASLSAEAVKDNARLLMRKLDRNGPFSYEIKEHDAELGGGTMPGEMIKSYALSVNTSGGINKLESWLRAGVTPIIAIIQGGELLLDLRTVEKEDVNYIASRINEFCRMLSNCN